MLLKRIVCTLQLMLYTLLPAAGGSAAFARTGAVRRCEPRQILGGMDHLLDSRGELRLFIPRCLAIAAPFILFRLKREGFSCCTVQASDQGLYVRGRR